MKKFIIENEFWEIFPNSKVGVVVCNAIDNHIKDNDEYKKVNEDGLYGLVINYFANEVEDGSSGKSYTAKYVFEAK